MNKWIGISLGTLVGLTHIGMIGLLISRNEFPQLNLPITDYTSYSVEAGKDGYRINYRANDPLVMGVRKDIKKPAGFLGLGQATMRSEEQYTMDGSRHLESGEPGKLSAAQVACIKAAGGGESTGKIVGVASAPLLLVLVSPLFLMLVGCSLVLLPSLVWNRERK